MEYQNYIHNIVERNDKMFYGVLHNAKGLTANELFHFLERAIAHGDGESIVYASSKPVIMISCEPSCVLMEIKENKDMV
jgi:hypothetical protein